MKHVFTVLLLISSFSITAQESKVTFGIKTGLNYGDNGKITFSDIANASENIASKNGDSRIGYHIGIFLRGKISDNIYIKPELQYTQNNSSYSFEGRQLSYDVKKIDVPILLGISILGPLHVFGGPALQYIVDNELEDVRLGDVKNDFTVGVQFGAGLQLGRFNADIRYERGISKNQAENIDETTGQSIRVDSRPNQLIISIAIDL